MIYDRLVADAGVHAIVADRIYDARPVDGAFPCITFGPSSFLPEDYECIAGRVETIQLDCWSEDQGRLNPCKDLVDAVKDALHLFDGALTINALVSLELEQARVFIDQDGITAHGVVVFTALIEEN